MKDKIRIEFDKIPQAFLASTHRVVQEKLFELGIVWADLGKTVSGKTVSYTNAKILWVDKKSITWSNSRDDEWPNNSVQKDRIYVMPGDFDKMVKYLSNSDEEVTLNGEYTATVTKDCVKVGCQTFTFKAVEALHAAVLRAKGRV